MQRAEQGGFVLARWCPDIDVFISARPIFVFAGGYTAGHITPGLAVIERLRERGWDGDFLFLGTANSWERELVSGAGVPFVGLPAMPWAGQTAVTRLRALLRLAPAVWAARRRLRGTRVHRLVGLGSFASVAPALAARSLGIPVTLYEPNATPGLANRLLCSSADALLVSRLFSGRADWTRADVREVGVPLRADLLALAGQVPDPPRAGLRLLVLGGSHGNPFLNERMPALAQRLAVLRSGLSVIHQCGHDVAPEPLEVRYAEAGVAAEVTSYLDPIAPSFQGADFVVSAAGAISLHELAAAGVPALVVPLDSGAGSHQQFNAAAFARLTGCLAVKPADWDPGRLAAEIAGVVRDGARWRTRQTGLRALVTDDDAERFARAAFGSMADGLLAAAA